MSVAYKVVAPLVLVKDADGVTHHAYQGAVLDDLDKEQLDHLLGLGFVAKVGSDPAVIVPGTEFLVPDSVHVAEVVAPGHIFDEPAADPVTDVEGRPAKVAPKAEWVDYAISQGADPKEAEATNKADLIELYGG
jgi:hypothetical protein